MSAAIDGIGPVSVRYAAQIRDLLYSQAVQRMAAEQQAARAADAAVKEAQLHPKTDAEALAQASVDLAPSANDAPAGPTSSSASDSSNDAADTPKPAIAQVVDIKA